jgi:hypothetical protein
VDTTEAAFIRTALAPLCGRVQDAIADSHEEALAYLGEKAMLEPAFASTATHLARAHLGSKLRALCADQELGDWRVSLGKNCSISLSLGGLQLRMLRPLTGMTVPPPGGNSRRRAFYRQQLSQVNLLGVQGSDLIGIWDYRPKDLLADIRIVRTVDVWGIGSPELIDLDFILPNSTIDLLQLEFVPTDEDLGSLPMFDGDAVEDGESGDAGARW